MSCDTSETGLKSRREWRDGAGETVAPATVLRNPKGIPMRLITREKIRSAIGRFALPELTPSWRDLPAVATLEIGKKSKGFRYYSILKYRGITYRKVTYVIPDRNVKIFVNNN